MADAALVPSKRAFVILHLSGGHASCVFSLICVAAHMVICQMRVSVHSGESRSHC